MHVWLCACHYPTDIAVIYVCQYTQDRCQRIVFVYYQVSKTTKSEEKFQEIKATYCAEGVFIPSMSEVSN